MSFNKEQVDVLVLAFKGNPYPGIDMQEQLMKRIGASKMRILVWFQNKSAKNHLENVTADRSRVPTTC